MISANPGACPCPRARSDSCPAIRAVAFRAAREPVPPNINDKANLCVKNGHFMEHSEKKDNTKAWLVTRTGEEVVLAGFGRARSQ